MRNVIVLTFFTLTFLYDVVTDLKDQVPLSHIRHEIVLFGVAIIALIWQISGILKRDKKIKSLNFELLETKQSYQKWVADTKESADKIRSSIDKQFNTWELTASEKDVALLLIKGLSMKEIADIRHTQEKTVRHQAASIYKKSSLSGRQELSAFFLEDILSTPIQNS